MCCRESPSIISCELTRISGQRDYRPKQAQQLAFECRAINAHQINETTWQFIKARLQEQWS